MIADEASEPTLRRSTGRGFRAAHPCLTNSVNIEVSSGEAMPPTNWGLAAKERRRLNCTPSLSNSAPLATVRDNRGFVNLIRERFKGGQGAHHVWTAPVDQGLFCGFALIVVRSMSAPLPGVAL